MFDRSTWIKLPRDMLQGHGALDDLLATVDELYLSGDLFLVTSPSPDRIAGDWVRDQSDGITSISLGHASFESVERAVDAAREADAGYLVALGGGKPIGVTKMASDRLDCGSISVLTAASHDGIVPGRSLIPEGDTRHPVVVDPSLAVVADTELFAEAPWEPTTAGCAGVISNYIAVKDWELVHCLKDVEYSEYAGALSQMIVEMLASSADSIKLGLEEPAWIVTKVLVPPGVAMSTAGSSRPASGAEYLFSHQLDRIAPGSALYDHQVGVGSTMTEHFHSGARDEWTDIRDTLLTMGAPTTADELGIDDKTIIGALTAAHEIRDHHTTLSSGVSKEAAIEAATITGVIQAHLFTSRVVERPLAEKPGGKEPRDSASGPARGIALSCHMT